MFEDGKGITCELDDDLAVADLINVPVRKLGSDDHGTQQVIHSDECHAVQLISEPDPQQHFAGRAEHVSGRIAKRWKLLFGDDEMFPSFGK